MKTESLPCALPLLHHPPFSNNRFKFQSLFRSLKLLFCNYWTLICEVCTSLWTDLKDQLFWHKHLSLRRGNETSRCGQLQTSSVRFSSIDLYDRSHLKAFYKVKFETFQNYADIQQQAQLYTAEWNRKPNKAGHTLRCITMQLWQTQS